MIQYPQLGFQASKIPKLTAVSLGVAVYVIYVISSVILHHTDKFPETSISGTAANYPQYIIFRLATMSGSTFIILSWFINDFYISSVIQNSKANCIKYFSKITLIFGIMGALFLMGSTANIDDGVRKQKWHLACAKGFFLFTVLTCFFNTIIYNILYFRYKSVTSLSAILKLILMILSIIQIYLSIVLHSQTGELEFNAGNFFEYSMTYTVCAYMYLIGKDVQNFKLNYYYQLI